MNEVKTEFSIKDIIKNNVVEFESLSASFVNYGIWVNDKGYYVFPVPLNDIGTATLGKKEKAILFMRWIRKAIDEGTFIHYNRS